MYWEKLLHEGRLGDKRNRGTQIGRTAFQRDFDRIVFSSAFRRLQDKTQVFPVPDSDFVHSRLTHSIEVSSVGRTLGNMAGEYVLGKHPDLLEKGYTASVFGDVVAAASLAHDVGNPPFGHSGEDAISEFFMDYRKRNSSLSLSESQWADLTRYEGNAHGFRLLTNHHPGQIQGGLRLTYATLATFTKYPRASWVNQEYLKEESFKRTSAKKFNFFQTELSYFRELADAVGLISLSAEEGLADAWCRHPLSFLVEAADNICYRLIDLEDGYKLGYMPFAAIEALLMPFMEKADDANEALQKYALIDDQGEQIGYLRARAISSLLQESFFVFKQKYDEIMSGTFDDELTNHIASYDLLEKDIKKANIYLYNRKPVVEIEITGFKIISGLLEIYLNAQYSPQKALNKKLLSQLPPQFLRKETDGDYELLMKTVDFVARMSDSYALNLYRRLSGQKLPSIG
jgi:dGTPase